MRVGIVNDLPLAREALRRVVTSVPGYSVAWQAEDGAAAVRLATRDTPDVILMDLVMPNMDGVEATRLIMQQAPCPIVLVTASMAVNHNLVMAAMRHGGLYAVNTPVLNLNGQLRDADKLLALLARLEQGPGPGVTLPQKDGPLVAIGASTGGPEALGVILERLPAGLPAAVVIVQHIPAEFASGLVDVLRRRTPLLVGPAKEGERPRSGSVAVAVTNDHLMLGPDGTFRHVREPVKCPFRPSINVLFGSLVEGWPRPGVAVLLTGMLEDGATGLLTLRRAGWHTIAQDEATSVVYGMPKAAIELKAACQVLPLPQIAAAIQTRVLGLRG